MHLILGQRIDDVGHALASVFGIAGVRETRGQFAERLKGVLGRFLIAFGQVLLGDPGKKTQVVVEVDQAFQVERVIQCRAGRVKLHEPVERGDGLCLFASLVLRIGLVQLGLLGQGSACCAAFQLFEQWHRLVESTAVEFVLGFRVNAVGAPARCLVFRSARAARKQAGGQQGSDKRQ